MKEIEIKLPNLETSVFDLLEDKHTAFSEATEVHIFPFGYLLIVDAFLSLARLKSEKVGAYLGLSLAEKTNNSKDN